MLHRACCMFQHACCVLHRACLVCVASCCLFAVLRLGLRRRAPHREQSSAALSGRSIALSVRHGTHGCMVVQRKVERRMLPIARCVDLPATRAAVPSASLRRCGLPCSGSPSAPRAASASQRGMVGLQRGSSSNCSILNPNMPTYSFAAEAEQRKRSPSQSIRSSHDAGSGCE